MNRSFAHNSHTRRATATRIAHLLAALASALLLGACATLPPPTSELAAAQEAVAHAGGIDADQYAGDTITQARSELSQAQAAMAKGRDDDARALAGAATADAELASAISNAEKTRADQAQRRDEIAQLRQRLQMQDQVAQESLLDGSAASTPPAIATGAPAKAAVVGALAARLQSLDADPRLGGFAAYERLRAHQAVDSQAAAYGRMGDSDARIADRRVAIAELAARTEATRREIDRLDRQRSELLVEASRRDAEQARQETERLRLQAQVQAEETQRLRAQAEAADVARQRAEDVIVDVGAAEAAKLKAAQDKDAALAKQEAELEAASSKASRTAPEPSRPTARGKIRKPADPIARKKNKTK